LAQNELRQEVMTQDEQLGKVRQEYEMLRLEFEQNLANNEQSGPLTKEIRQQYISLKQELQQQKQDVTRFKRKWREAVSSIARVNFLFV
jgi:E3 ubiquitin-protein ligase BRE1